MNRSQTFHAAAAGGRASFLWADRYWTETLARFHKEGMPQDVHPSRYFGFDLDEYDGFLYDTAAYLYDPPIVEAVIADEGATQLVTDVYGVVKRVFKDRSGMPQFVRFPVESHADWDGLLPRLAVDDSRLSAERARRMEGLSASGEMTTAGMSHLCGFFSFLRELCGDRCYTLLYDDPGLVADMVRLQTGRLIALLRFAAAHARVDRLFIWEDMAYKNGPLISPKCFAQVFAPGYAALIDAARALGVRVVDVDSDGYSEPLIPVWLDAGVTMHHPFEVQAGMDVCAIGKKYPNLAMHGGVDKRALALGPSAIDQELARIRPALERGGYIPHVDHSVPPNVSLNDYRYYLDGLAHICR